MVKKFMTGLAISVGAGLALAATTTRTPKKGMFRPATNTGSMTPVTIRVHSAVPRAEQLRTELARTDSAPSAHSSVELVRQQPPVEVPAAVNQSVELQLEALQTASLHSASLQASHERTAELAEIRLMIDALDRRSMEMMGTVNQRIDDLQNHLPRFIDVKVTSRIREVEERLGSRIDSIADAPHGEVSHAVSSSSRGVERADRAGEAASSWESWCAASRVGVPPPTKIVSTSRGEPMRLISISRAVR